MHNTPQAMYTCMFDTEKHTLTHRRASTEGPCRRGQPPPEAKTPLPHTNMVSRRHHFGLQSIGLDYRNDNNLPSHGRCSQQRMCWRQRISSIRHQTQKCGSGEIPTTLCLPRLHRPKLGGASYELVGHRWPVTTLQACHTFILLVVIVIPNPTLLKIVPIHEF